MKLHEVLQPEMIIPVLQGSDKQQVLTELFELLVRNGKLDDQNREQAWKALLAREEMCSTGIQNGVAIPHCKSSAVDDMIACVGIAPGGIDFNALDGEPSTIFVLTIAPFGESSAHMRLLSDIGKLLRHSDKRNKITAAQSREEIFDLLANSDN